MGQLTLDLAGSGPFVDLDAVARDQAAVPFLEDRVKTIEERLARASDAQAKKDLAGTL